MRYKDRRQTRAWRTTELQPRLHGNLPYEPSSAGQRTTHIKKLHQASVESSKTTWHTSGPLADLPLSPDKVEQNKILEERVGKERKEREQLTRQKASEKSLWLLYGTTLRIMFPYCIMLNPLFFLYFFEETLHFRLVALVSQSGFWTIGSIGMLPTWLQRTLTRPDKCVSARSVSSRSGNLIPAPSDHKCVH